MLKLQMLEPIAKWFHKAGGVHISLIMWLLLDSFSCSTFTNYIYTIKFILHQQIHDETYAITGLKIGPPLLS